MPGVSGANGRNDEVIPMAGDVNVQPFVIMRQIIS